MATTWGYARVSTRGQSYDAQLDALRRRGVDADHLVTEVVSGTAADRPGQSRIMTEANQGDTVVVVALDRWGRSMAHLVETVTELTARGVAFVSIREGIDATTAAGRLALTLFGGLAEFEREIIRERTAASREARKARGLSLGRTSQIKPAQVELVRRLDDEGNTQRGIADATGLSQATVNRIINGQIKTLPTAPADDAAPTLNSVEPAPARAVRSPRRHRAQQSQPFHPSPPPGVEGALSGAETTPTPARKTRTPGKPRTSRALGFRVSPGTAPPADTYRPTLQPPLFSDQETR